MDNYASLQLATALEPQVGMRIDILSNYGNNNNDIVIQSQGIIRLVSNGSNIPKEDGRFYKKGDSMVLLNANADRNEDESTIFVSIRKISFNKQV